MIKILVIDDIKAMREELESLLSLEGYEVISAENGWQAINLAKSQQPDLIICDIDMPGMDGYEVFTALHAESQTALIPFIFLTGKDSMDALRIGMNLGADDYLVKPFELDDLLTSIHNRIARSSALSQASYHQAQLEKERLISRISHELRNPVSSMKLAPSFIKQLMGNKLPPHMGKILETYQGGVERLERLTEQMLLQVRIEAKTINQNTVWESSETLSLRELLCSALKLACQFSPERDFLEVDISIKDENARLLANPDLLKHALAELIANALDFSNDNRAVVIKQWTKDNQISILLINEGRSIPSDELDLIFEPFQRAYHDQDNRKGLGLGLSLARHIISAHGGKLKLMSSEQGTSVLVQIPAC